MAALFGAPDEALLARTGQARFDVLVNKAAVSRPAGLEDTAEALIDEMFDTNVKGPLFVLKEVVKRLRDGGRVINVSSSITRIPIARPVTPGPQDQRGIMEQRHPAPGLR